MSAVITPKRCAVYTRVSTDERLDQTFNSIDAQRESGQAYVVSQRGEGWTLVPDDYASDRTANILFGSSKDSVTLPSKG